MHFLPICYFYSIHKHVKNHSYCIYGCFCVLTDDKHPEVDVLCRPSFPAFVNFLTLRKITEYFGLCLLLAPCFNFFLVTKHTETSFLMVTRASGCWLAPMKTGTLCLTSGAEVRRHCGDRRSRCSSVSNSSLARTSSRVCFSYIYLKKQQNFSTAKHQCLES